MIDVDEPPERVAADYDLDLADVYRAHAYDHPEEMRAVRTERSMVPDGIRVVRPEDADGPEEPEPEA